MGSATHNAALDDMSEDDLHAELKQLIRQMQPAKGPGFPQLDLTQFHQIHDELARVFDPTGKHKREVAEAVSNGTRHSRRLSYLGIINSAGYRINTLVQNLGEKSNKTKSEQAETIAMGIANIVVYVKQVNESMMEMFESLGEDVSLRNYSPTEDLTLFYSNVVRPATPNRHPNFLRALPHPRLHLSGQAASPSCWT